VVTKGAEMGEIAEMMFEGILCQHCGVALCEGPEYEPPGHPVSCQDCRRDKARKRGHGRRRGKVGRERSEP
jgi:hypothetical protein